MHQFYIVKSAKHASYVQSAWLYKGNEVKHRHAPFGLFGTQASEALCLYACSKKHCAFWVHHKHDFQPLPITSNSEAVWRLYHNDKRLTIQTVRNAIIEAFCIWAPWSPHLTMSSLMNYFRRINSEQMTAAAQERWLAPSHKQCWAKILVSWHNAR